MLRRSREPRSATLSRAAKGWLLGLAVLLALPTVLMGLQGRDELEYFHNRVLAPWPAARTFGRDPATWFARVNRWLADRAYPIVAAVHLRNDLAYRVLGASPAPNVTVAPGGLVFLNGTDPDHENDLVRSACLVAAEPGTGAAVESALERIATFGRRRGLAVDVLMVPTVPLLYGDRLPRSYPSALRAACAAGPAGRAPLSRIRAPEGVRFLYPFGEMSALRDDPAMFPLGDFHPDGLSVKTASDGYLRAIGAAVPADLALALTSAPSEVLADYGVIASFPVYAVSGSGTAYDPEAAASLRAALRAFYDGPVDTNVYRDPAAPNPETLLIVSDSYGQNQAVSLSAAFRTVVQTPTPSRDLVATMDAIRGIVPFDRLLLVFNDSNVLKLVDIGRALSATADR